MYAASSGEALGITPGSEKLVLNKVERTNINNSPPTTGMTGLTSRAKKGQLQKKVIIMKIRKLEIVSSLKNRVKFLLKTKANLLKDKEKSTC